MHLQTIVHSVAFFGIENAAAHFQDSRAKIHSKAAIHTKMNCFFGYSPGIPTPQGERGTGRSCFLYSGILPHPGEAVKHFYALFSKKMPGQGNGGTAFLPFPR